MLIQNIKTLINQIENEGEKLKSLDNLQLKNHIFNFKKLQKKQDLENLLVPCFALVQEIASRKIGLRHYQNQVFAGIKLHYGNIIEMSTGEGKTLVSTLPIALNALTKKGVHVVTTNEYLAERDCKWMKTIFDEIGLSVGLIKNSYNINDKKINYKKNITYITSSELVFDYLKDNTTFRKSEIVQPDFNFCLIDEADSILIDEARTPLIISEENQTNDKNKIHVSLYIAEFLENTYHFTIDQKRKDIFLTDQGSKKIQALLGITNIYDSNNPWTLEILNALKAKYLYKKNKDYVILDKKIAIIDEFSGRVMRDRRWSFGLHEAIEAKENLLIGNITENKASITYQNFFPLYPKLAGMTGTAFSSKEEFKSIYKLEVIQIFPNKPCKRVDLSDQIFISELSKWKAIVKKIIEKYNSGQPILIGTSSIEKSDYLSTIFSSLNLPHNLLNAKPENAKNENEIIAQAGKLYALTIATNMAGRGTDIILGGNLPFLLKKLIKNKLFLFLKKDYINEESNIFTEIITAYNFEITKLKKDIENIPYSLENCEISLKLFYKNLYEKNYSKWLKENEKVKELGGLFVLGTERAESRRIDDQLRGRSGRQGDPGESQFYLSLEDNLLKTFGGKDLKKNLVLSKLNLDTPISSSLMQKAITDAQKKIEDYYFKIRENVFNYESIISFERKTFYDFRKNILTIKNYEKFLINFVNIFWDFKNSKNFYLSTILKSKNKNLAKLFLKWAFLEMLLKKYYFYKYQTIKDIFSFFFLSILDDLWINHINNIYYIKETISWNAYGQQNPLDEYFLQCEKFYDLTLKKSCYFLIYCLLFKSMLHYFIINK